METTLKAKIVISQVKEKPADCVATSEVMQEIWTGPLRVDQQ